MSQTLIIFTPGTKNQHVWFRFWYLLWPLCNVPSLKQEKVKPIIFRKYGNEAVAVAGNCRHFLGCLTGSFYWKQRHLPVECNHYRRLREGSLVSRIYTYVKNYRSQHNLCYLQKSSNFPVIGQFNLAFEIQRNGKRTQQNTQFCLKR